MQERSRRQHAGRCPTCGTPLDAEAVVVRYETEGGWPSIVADCGSCGLVHPA